jgi:hypothetical protein
MEEELKLGDTLVLDRTNGARMTVHYLLPRETEQFCRTRG